MITGARNIHALSATLRRLEHEAATGQCAICGQPSVGFVEGWDNRPQGICAEHASLAPRHGYTVHADPYLPDVGSRPCERRT